MSESLIEIHKVFFELQRNICLWAYYLLYPRNRARAQIINRKRVALDQQQMEMSYKFHSSDI